jgi:hypothetical protein
MTPLVGALGLLLVGAGCGSPAFDESSSTSTAGAEAGGRREVMGGLTVELRVPASVHAGDTLSTTMLVENGSGRPIEDANCGLSNTRHALVPEAEPDAELWSWTMTQCAGPFTYVVGFRDEWVGPTFAASDRSGVPLPPGDYVAAWDVQGERFQYPVTVLPPA